MNYSLLSCIFPIYTYHICLYIYIKHRREASSCLGLHTAGPGLPPACLTGDLWSHYSFASCHTFTHAFCRFCLGCTAGLLHAACACLPCCCIPSYLPVWTRTGTVMHETLGWGVPVDGLHAAHCLLHYICCICLPFLSAALYGGLYLPTIPSFLPYLTRYYTYTCAFCLPPYCLPACLPSPGLILYLPYHYACIWRRQITTGYLPRASTLCHPSTTFFSAATPAAPTCLPAVWFYYLAAPLLRLLTYRGLEDLLPAIKPAFACLHIPARTPLLLW